MAFPGLFIYFRAQGTEPHLTSPASLNIPYKLCQNDSLSARGESRSAPPAPKECTLAHAPPLT